MGLDSAGQRLVTQGRVSRPGPGLRVGLRPERPGAPQGAGSPARRCLATHGRSRQRGGWGLAGQRRLSPEPWWVCGGAWAGRSHHLHGHFRLLGLRGCQSKLAEGEPSTEKESPLNRRKPRCVLPSAGPAAISGCPPSSPCGLLALRAPRPACPPCISCTAPHSPWPPACLLPHSLRPPAPSGGLRPAQDLGESRAGSPLRGSGGISVRGGSSTGGQWRPGEPQAGCREGAWVRSAGCPGVSPPWVPRPTLL